MKHALKAVLWMSWVLCLGTVAAHESDGDHIHTTSLGDDSSGISAPNNQNNPGNTAGSGGYATSGPQEPPKPEYPELKQAASKEGNGSNAVPYWRSIGIPGAESASGPAEPIHEGHAVGSPF